MSVSLSAAPTKSELQAALKANRDAEKKVGTKIAKALIKEAPAHTFNTGSEGRRIQMNTEIDGRPVMVLLQVVFRDTVKKDA